MTRSASWAEPGGQSLDIPARTPQHGEIEHKDAEDAAVDPFASPALYPQQQSDSVPAIDLDVDGEVFELRPDETGGTGYSWLIGPNPGYGFGSSLTLDYSLDDHRNSIRSFLAMVDPTTGYIEDN